jgi:tetratricopeptide (TPR) repeat protein
MATWHDALIPNWAARALLALTLCVPATAGAEPLPVAESADAVAKAEDLAARAFDAYRQGRHTDALDLYEQAYASAPSADALYNIARVYDVGLGDRTRAIAAYERCLLEPGASPERLARAGERLMQLRSSAALALPAQSWPAEPNAPAPPAPAGSEPAPPEGWSWLHGASVISGAAGVIGLGVGIGFGLAASSDAQRANAACDGNRCRSQQGVDAAESASERATLATVGVGAGVALLASSLTLWLLSDGGDVAPEAQRERQPGVSLAPVAGTRELGLAVEGRWY